MSSMDPPTKNWWSLSKASGNNGLRHNVGVKPDGRPSTAKGLKSIAVAIGLKPKKSSREPISPAGGQVSDTASGPKSPSSTHSPVDSPYDTRLQPPRQSLLTIADDPFAGHPPVVFVHQSPVASHLSVYSSPSITDLAYRKTDSPVYRTSYASSSTNSNSLGPELNSTSRHIFPESKKLHLKRSIGSMQVKLPDNLSRQTSCMFSTSRSSPSVEGPVPLSDEAPARPKMRSRGMTVGGVPQKSAFFVKEQMAQRKLSQASPTPTTPALVKPPESPSKLPFLLRSTSTPTSRLFAPPTAPPNVSLPAPPQTAPEQPEFRQRKGLNSLPPFSSSSSVSLVNDQTSLNSTRDDCQTSKQDFPIDDDPFSENVELSSKTTISSPRTLKKPPSQRSLRRAASPASSMSSKTTTPDPSEKRKQRNSQQSRLPMSTLSLSIRTSFVSTLSQPRNGDPASPSSIQEQRKTRRRLFSSSQRPSTSTSVLARHRGDDTSSVLSQRSDHDPSSHYKPWAVTRNYPKPSSFWEEGPDTTPSNPVVANPDYQPQAIMSRDELAKLEASISDITSKQHTPLDSILSFPPSNDLEQEPSRLAFSPPTSPAPNSIRSSDATLASSTSRFDSRRRPFTADALVRDSSKEAGIDAERLRRLSNTPQLVMIPDSTSLPPPPRRRILSSNSIRSTASTSTTSTLIQSPVEYPKVKQLDRPSTAITTSSPLQPGALGTGGLLNTVPRSIATQRGKSRTSGLEKAIHRRSLMRKPSFLEIDGETDPESEPEVAEKRDSLFLHMKPPSAATVANGSSKTGASFLDLARESFDTVRS